MDNKNNKIKDITNDKLDEILMEEEINEKLKDVLKEKKFKEENSIPGLLMKGSYFVLKGISRALRNKDLLEIDNDNVKGSKKRGK